MSIFGAKKSCCSAKELHGKRYSPRRYTADGFRASSIARPLPRMFFVLGAVLAALAVPFVLMNDLRRDGAIAEWWTRNIQAGWEKAVGTLTSWLPFSVFELFVVLAIITGVFLIVRLFINLCSGRFKRVAIGALSLGVAALYVLDIYVLSMGFGYYRAAMPLPQSGEKYTERQVVEAVEYFLADYTRLAEKFERNDDGCVISPYTFDELAELLIKEYSRLDGGGYFAAYTPKAKPVTNSKVLSSMLITGITFLPFGEANVNTDAPPTGIAATMAHELAHAKGVQREGDANLLSYYILLSSSDDYLRYCGYYATFDNLLSAVLLFDNSDEYNRLRGEVSGLVYTERAFARVFWNGQWDIVGQIAEFFNDVYLTLNGALNGTDSYYDGNVSDVIISTDPGTGEQQKKIVFSQIQKMFFYIYEQAV